MTTFKTGNGTITGRVIERVTLNGEPFVIWLSQFGERYMLRPHELTPEAP